MLIIEERGVDLLKKIVAGAAQTPEGRGEILKAASAVGMSRKKIENLIAEGEVLLKPDDHIAHVSRRIAQHDRVDATPTS